MKRKRINFTPEEDRKFAQLHLDEGLTCAEIADKVGASFSGISHAISRYIKNGRRILKD